MFGVGDNNQAQAQNGPALPPSPFMEPSAPPVDHPAMQHPGSVEPVAVAPSPLAMPEHDLTAPAPDSLQPSMPAPAVHAPQDDDLLVGIKQQALSNLTPLVGHLDQTPEERFKTTMMLIQASDNADLVKDAYEAASHIADEKERAQALLDVVNEINYFTQKDSTDKKL